MAVILVIANHNRGAGKTVTAANVAAGFARARRRGARCRGARAVSGGHGRGVTWRLAYLLLKKSQCG